MARRCGGRSTAVWPLVAVAVLAAGCAGRSGAAGRPAARPATVERLAAAAGCAPAIEANAADLREGTCATERGGYVLATFRTTAGMRAWLDRSRAFDGAYLVGARWVVAGSPAALRPLQRRLGGTVERAAP